MIEAAGRTGRTVLAEVNGSPIAAATGVVSCSRCAISSDVLLTNGCANRLIRSENGVSTTVGNISLCRVVAVEYVVLQTVESVAALEVVSSEALLEIGKILAERTTLEVVVRGSQVYANRGNAGALLVCSRKDRIDS